MKKINRNVSIVIVILVLVVIAGYLVWLRSRVQTPVSPITNTDQMIQSPSPSASASANMATSSGKEATGSMKAGSASSSGAKK